MARVRRGVACYGPIVLRRVVVGVAVARVDGGADGRQLGGPRAGGRVVVRMGVGMGRGVVVVLLVRQGDGVGRLMRGAKSSWCLVWRLGLVVSWLPLGPCHHSFARVAVHGRNTNSNGGSSGGSSSEASARAALRRHRRAQQSAAWRCAAAGRCADGRLLAGCSSCGAVAAVTALRRVLATATTGWAARGSADEGADVRAGVDALGQMIDHTEPLALCQLSVRFPVNRA